MQKIAKCFLWDNMLSMAAFWASAGTVAAGLTSYYQLPLTLANIIVGLPATLPFLQVFGDKLYRRASRPAAFLYGTNVAWRVLLPMAYFTVLLPWQIGRVAAVVLYFCAVSAFQICTPAQTTWMVNQVNKSASANYYALREMCFMLAYCGAFISINLILSSGSKQGTEKLSFAAAGLIQAFLLGISIVTLLRLPKPQKAKSASSSSGSLLAAWQHKPFQRVAILNMVWCFLTMLIGNYASLYQVRVMQVSFVQLLIWISAGNILRALCTPLSGKLAIRIGWTSVIRICVALYAVCGLMWACLRSSNFSWLYPLAAIWSALPFAGITVGFLQLQVATTQEDNRSSSFAIAALCNAIGALAGSGVCSVLIAVIEHWGLSLQLPFLLGAVLCGTLAVYLFGSKNKEPCEASIIGQI